MSLSPLPSDTRAQRYSPTATGAARRRHAPGEYLEAVVTR
jgi:hypothetical protein